uniref:Microtubule crosslinking factor 2 n=1 Tax=Nothobranchius furzeri TaxID=105023 RepID=A0A8C6LEW7_NOTFU
MLEMRDMYLEEDVYQLQELRQQLEQANKTCRILQYRLRKSERRSLRVAQTGHVDGELIRTLEQDVKVAKDVSIRLHSQLDSVEKKRSRLEKENEELRVRLQELEVAKQVLQQEIDKNSQKKGGARANNKADKKPAAQEDSSDLKCQLHFAKEESALMCKKLTKLVKDGEAMKEELAKYRSMYGDVNASLTVEEVADSPHTREAEVRVHLKLVEEEANLLSRRIVELEVENRGLRAEMDDMKGSPTSCLSGGATVLGGGVFSENVMELQRHLQFVEEEAELLRRSLIEMEEQNKLLMNEINRYKSELPPTTSTDSPTHEEELRSAQLQVGELSGKVKKLQYENRVLLSNLQRCDLASYHAPSSSSSSRLALETDAEAGDSAECLPFRYVFHLQSEVGLSERVLKIRLSVRQPAPSERARCNEAAECDLEKPPPLSQVPSLCPGRTLNRFALLLILSFSCSQLQEEHQKALIRRDFQLQSLAVQARLQQKLWSQERTLLVQESQHLKQALLLLSLKLRCFLKQWRLGCKKDAEWKDVLEMNSLNDLYLLLEEENLSTTQTDKQGAAEELSQTIKVRSTLADLRVALQDLSAELRQERQGSQELTQQFAKAKASWEVERTELKSVITQLESKAGKATAALSAPETLDPIDLKVALKKEREEHQHLLAESYAAVMDLTKQLQIGERNWSREKVELLERFSRERAQWEQRLREAAAQQEKVRHAETMDSCKTWDGPSVSHSSLVESQSDLEFVQRSYTAPDRSGIRIYYSPPAVRRVEPRRRNLEPVDPPPPGSSSLGHKDALSSFHTEPPASSFTSSYEQWLSSLSKQHRELLESRSSCISSSMPSIVISNVSSGADNRVVDGMTPTSPFHNLDIGEISANLSDDMKEMTNCVRQAIRSSSLERKSSKEPGNQVTSSNKSFISFIQLF